MLINITEKVKEIYQEKYGFSYTACFKLPQSGSYRQYFRLVHEDHSVIGVYNNDISENNAFLSFTKSFRSINLPVPDIIGISHLQDAYLLEDLGEQTVFEIIKKHSDQSFIIELYKKIIDYLIIFQFDGFKVIDFSCCYPRDKFDAQSVRWDLNYFKYDFLKLLKISFNEQDLENDFNSLIGCFEEIPCNAFLYRDFQSSNIMLKDGKLYFIDYQGGRKGSFYYDLASLLFDAKANLSDEIRTILKNYYFNKIQERIIIDRNTFDNEFSLFVLIRILQALGAYGFRGVFERKSQFIQSIPLAVKNLNFVTENYHFPVEIPEIKKIIRQLTIHPQCIENLQNKEKLTISVNSFSYKNGIPYDESGHGGGFVFDCRGLPNPGRYPEYSDLTGKDQLVIDFFKDKKEMTDFLHYIFAIVDRMVINYLERNYSHLMISFGCTGGQHRSVYSAEHMAAHLRKYNVNIVLKHYQLSDIC